MFWSIIRLLITKLVVGIFWTFYIWHRDHSSIDRFISCMTTSWSLDDMCKFFFKDQNHVLFNIMLIGMWPWKIYITAALKLHVHYRLNAFMTAMQFYGNILYWRMHLSNRIQPRPIITRHSVLVKELSVASHPYRPAPSRLWECRGVGLWVVPSL